MFIYEYVGDVVSNPSFIKRMREYAGEGIEHFYFMMLQKDEVGELPFGSTRSLWYANRGLFSCYVAVHRRNQARWHWPFRKSLL